MKDALFRARNSARLYVSVPMHEPMTKRASRREDVHLRQDIAHQYEFQFDQVIHPHEP